MAQKLRFSLGLILAALLCAGPLFGHHAFESEFSDQKPITITGVVTKVDWVNPHVFIYLDVKDSDGLVSNWSFQTMPPGLLHSAGLTKEMLIAGQTITIDAYGAKDDLKKLGWIRRVHFPNGQMVEMLKASPSDAPRK